MRNLKIIIAEDDVDDQFLIEQAISNLHIPLDGLIFFKNGSDILHYLFLASDAGELPDLLILDLNMPLIDGEDVLKKVKADPGLSQIPVFILTTSKRPEHIRICREYNCAGFYNKPYKMVDLQRIIKEIFEKTSQAYSS
jgi:CheY-like chemotaxis protein